MAPGATPQMPPSGTAPAADDADDTGEFAAAKKIFRANCARCHSIGGRQIAGGPGGPPFGPGPGGPPPGGPGPAGGPPPGGENPGGPPPGGPGAGGPPPGGPGPGGFRGMMPRGPDLGKVGANPDHTVEWLVAFIKNPKASKPQSRMPEFGTKLSDDDLKALAEYLASLK